MPPSSEEGEWVFQELGENHRSLSIPIRQTRKFIIFVLPRKGISDGRDGPEWYNMHLVNQPMPSIHQV